MVSGWAKKERTIRLHCIATPYKDGRHVQHSSRQVLKLEVVGEGTAWTVCRVFEGIL